MLNCKCSILPLSTQSNLQNATRADQSFPMSGVKYVTKIFVLSPFCKSVTFGSLIELACGVKYVTKQERPDSDHIFGFSLICGWDFDQDCHNEIFTLL